MLYVGIDCGEHTGFAVWDSVEGKFLTIETLKLHQALERVLALGACIVVFEDARQRKWIPREKSVSEYRGKLMGAGSVKRDAVIWEEFLTDHGIDYIAKAPQKGATKMNADTFARITGWTGRTSNHGRDAGLLVLGR